jgi:hypothetical protein
VPLLEPNHGPIPAYFALGNSNEIAKTKESEKKSEKRG